VAVGIAGLTLAVSAWLWPGMKVSADGAALARVDVPHGVVIEQAQAVGPHGGVIPLRVRRGKLWPGRPLAAGEPVRITVTVGRPGEVARFLDRQVRLHLTLRTPAVRVEGSVLTLPAGAPLRVSFSGPVSAYALSGGGGSRRRTLPRPQRTITLARPAPAGVIRIAAAARSWEVLPSPVAVGWFPAGGRPLALVSPPAGSGIAPTGRIRLTFSRPVAAVLGRARPAIDPPTPGSWRLAGTRTLVFTPRGLGFGLGGQVQVRLPAGVALAGAAGTEAGRTASFSVAPGSTLRAQQLLARLGYLPLDWSPAAGGLPRRPGPELVAALRPPKGRFIWRYPDTPVSLRTLWEPGQDTTLLRGAVMAFERAHGLEADGVLGPMVWRALIRAALRGDRNRGGYTFVMVDQAVPQTLALWHDGKVVLTAAANTGIPAAPTAPGTFPVFEHIAVGTMSGTNPDGTHYDDPGIPWISYFHGGDAIHGFTRASYGSPQSLGCVELDFADAARVWPYTPVGTLVNVGT